MRNPLFSASLLVVLLSIACGAPTEPRAPEDLLSYIRAAEAAEIRESWGEESGQCFTWSDYDAFVRADRPAAVAAQFKSSPQFLKLLQMIEVMPQSDREALLARARGTANPTWAMMGRISRDGTTEAGRKAGLMIATAIANAVTELLGRR